ncbi:hypothetical protein CTAYLR_008684 [Chrysophaeum taylorii]|uniref:Uncharacterized protein n=1 Tax=Chrysophaeum taylorii TaxID=2483200 RepID=A0AAD7XRW8_9STRA|nr:hypothetical protein CTAYLR_008684 [Chrysophaeum taylorii]
MFLVLCAAQALIVQSPVQRALREAEGRLEEIRCPFWRRRAGDALETIGRFLASRHKTLLPAYGCGGEKRTHREVCAVMEDVYAEFTKRRYYVTGRLDASLYARDCVFDGPDPDMPVRGPEKFADALSGLFDHRSKCDLLSLEAGDNLTITALWRLEGVLRLPWRPSVKPFLGQTTYTLDEEGLIDTHIERWSISAFDAFASTLVPRILPGAPPAPPTSVLVADIPRAKALLI